LLGIALEALHRLGADAVDDLAGVFGSHGLIQHTVRTHAEQRPGHTKSHAPNATNGDFLFESARVNFLFKRLFHEIALAGKAARGHTDVQDCLWLRADG
jgi:hypothetical protein